ncbi:DMT family transporter [Candidatus Bipolaricaulota bacterium]|nr:DMT family transporter [Candidatus Bipolaricaulota bacterium]
MISHEPASTSLYRHRVLPIIEVLLASMIWGSSFVGVKMALAHAGPWTIAALRYSIAALLLAPFIDWRRLRRSHLAAGLWGRVIAIGLSQYTIGNAALFLALGMIPATSGSLALSLCPIPVWVFGVLALHERPNGLQLIGTAAAIAGSFLFFRTGLVPVPVAAIALLTVAILSFAVLPVIGRKLSKQRALGNIAITGVPLAIGGGVLVVIALLVEGVPHLPPATWGIILGLAVVNTVGGYLLFNHALQQMHAGEANVLLSLTPVSTAVIAWAAFGERLTVVQFGAMAIVIAGTILAQRRVRGQ